jgi:hypothetical protein
MPCIRESHQPNVSKLCSAKLLLEETEATQRTIVRVLSVNCYRQHPKWAGSAGVFSSVSLDLIGGELGGM